MSRPNLQPAHAFALAVAVYSAGLPIFAGAQGGASSDRAALEVVYHSTGGDGWTDNTNWLSDAPLGDWAGVEVDGDGRVTRLWLGGWDESAGRIVGNGLTGSLPPELGNLSRLRSLEAAGNSGLTGPIPPELGRLANLETLSLQENWLTGSIPPALGRLTGLQRVWLQKNALAGPVPPELGNLVDLRILILDNNALTGPVPPELGGLTSLRELDLGYTMLSGPLPESVGRLSALERMSLDGSGLCAPDSPAVRSWAAAIPDFTGAVCEGTASFSRLVTHFDLGRIGSVFAVADLNGDGRGDILGGERLDYDSEEHERLIKAPLHVFVGRADGGFRHAPELVEGTIDVRTPIVVADDFNGDGRADLAVFDAGVYVFERRVGAGNPPQLFLSGPDDRLRPSSGLADAVRREHERNSQGPGKGISGPSDLHLKSAASGDIDGDGDIDLWIDSRGGLNVDSHFMVNNGDGTFTVDETTRAPTALRHNPPAVWYHQEGHLVDLDNDGDLDLALGQNRRTDAATGDMFSIVLINDGTGHYPTRIVLPRPAFYDGYTSVRGQTHFDVDGDGFQDLMVVHVRNRDVLIPPITTRGTGRYVQVLTNGSGTSFVDESAARMGDQSATALDRVPDVGPLYADAQPAVYDVNRDGCPDLVMSRGLADVRAESPLAYRNDGSGGFRAMSPVPFVGSGRYFGRGAVPTDVNGDGAIDFVVPHHHDGRDRQHGTDDDFGMLVTLLNTSRPGSARCGAAANRPPSPAGALPNRTLALDGTLTVDVSQAFADPDGDPLTYTVSSSAPLVVAARATGAQVTLTAAAEGSSTILVTATDPGGLSATQSFTATVSTPSPSGPFTDDPLQPGVTPVKTVHFTELRSRINDLRVAAGLPRFAWTDPVLTPRVTPVKLAHLLELRSALGEAYSATGRPAPAWTDELVAGTTPTRAVHLMELRVAVLSLERYRLTP